MIEGYNLWKGVNRLTPDAITEILNKYKSTNIHKKLFLYKQPSGDVFIVHSKGKLEDGYVYDSKKIIQEKEYKIIVQESFSSNMTRICYAKDDTDVFILHYLTLNPKIEDKLNEKPHSHLQDLHDFCNERYSIFKEIFYNPQSAMEFQLDEEYIYKKYDELNNSNK